MSNSTSPRRTICLYCYHPLLPSEFARILEDEEFRLLTRRVAADAVTDPSKLTVPRASVFVLEAHRRAEATEALAGAVVSQHAGAKMLVIAEKFDEDVAFPLLRLGAKGLLTYAEVEAQLRRALRVIADAGFWVPRTLLSHFVDSTLSTTRRPRTLPIARRLSRREQEVLALLLENFSNKEIAGKLHISARTAKFHVSNLLAKHGVRRRADLILLAHTNPGA